MNWLKRSLYNWLNSVHEAVPMMCRNGSRDFQTNPVLVFTVYEAIGGTVFEFRKYNPHSDTSTQTLYIVAEGQSLGDKLEKLITLERLK